MVRLSVVMAVYNGAAQLGATLDSISVQTMSDYELIIVDDGSTDATPVILREYAQRDARIRVITQANVGLTRSLIRGCELARAPLIARHDAGDRSMPERFAKQLQSFDDEPSLVLASCWTDYVGPEDEFLYTARGTGIAREPAPVFDVNAKWGMTDGPTHHGSAMFRSNAYRDAGGYRAEFYYGQDWDLWYRLSPLGTCRVIAESLYIARLDLNAISSAARSAQRAIAPLSLAAARARASGKSESELLQRAAAVRNRRPAFCSRALSLYFIGELLRRNGDPRARNYFRRAIRSCPLHAKAWIRLAQALLS